jgi:hypothetical protein
MIRVLLPQFLTFLFIKLNIYENIDYTNCPELWVLPFLNF